MSLEASFALVLINGMQGRIVGQESFLLDPFFFFQAEDGIRDATVTGVQTCALPISPWASTLSARPRSPDPSCAAAPPTPSSSTSTLSTPFTLLARIDAFVARECLTTFARDRKRTRLNSSHGSISYDVFCLNKKIRG